MKRDGRAGIGASLPAGVGGCAGLARGRGHRVVALLNKCFSIHRCGARTCARLGTTGAPTLPYFCSAAAASRRLSPLTNSSPSLYLQQQAVHAVQQAVRRGLSVGHS